MELNELRKIAEVATPGPWEASDRGIGYEVHDASGYELNSGMRETFTESDATHIATFDPATVLALLSRLEQAEQAVARVREMATELRDTPASPESPKYARLLIEGAQAAGADMLRALDGDGRG